YHIQQDSDGLEEASRKNGELWRAVKTGDLPTVKRILHPETQTNGLDYDIEMQTTNGTNGAKQGGDEQDSSIETAQEVEMVDSLAAENEPPPIYDSTTATASRTSLSRSLASSVTSLAALSRTYSRNSEQMDISSPAKLARARNLQGDSLLMMAVHSRQPEVLQYLLRSEHFPPEIILE